MDSNKRIEVLDLINNLIKNVFQIDDIEEFKKNKLNLPILDIINLINDTKDLYKTNLLNNIDN